MSDKINIQEILNKHSINIRALKTAQNRDGKRGTEYDRIQAAIQEIVKATIDKCAEEAKLVVIPYDQEQWEVIPNPLKVSDLRDKSEMEDGEIEVDKECILNVKKMIIYETDNNK